MNAIQPDASAKRPNGSLSFFFPVGSLRPWMAVVAVIALAYRTAWALLRHPPFATGEAANVAVAFAHGNGFADAFRVGQGPSAHVLPLAPMIGGLIYSIFGIQTVLSETLLFLWSTSLVFFCYVVLAKCMERLRSPSASVLSGLVLLALLPIYTTKEVFDFRIWEGALGLALGAALLNILLSAEDDAAPRHLDLWLAILPAVTFFVSPPIGLAAATAEGIFLWRHRRRINIPKVIFGIVLASALVLGPWAARNQLLLGSPLLLRDNFGLELAIANYPSAVHPADIAHELDERLTQIHPRNSDQAYNAMLSNGGEVRYSRHLQSETIQWMMANPAFVTRIWLRHATEMLFTSPWMFQSGPPGKLATARSVLVAIVAVLGMTGLAVGVRNNRCYIYIVAYTIIPLLCYLPFQPISRYTWLIYPMLLYLTTGLCVRLNRKSSSGSAGVV